LVGKTVYHAKNSKELASQLKDLCIDEGSILNSHDVVSLFTKVPIPEALKVVRDRLEHDRTLHDRTLLTVNDIMKLLEFVCTTTYFSFDGTIYQQCFGTAMGSPVSPVLANLYMEWLEQKANSTAPSEIRPTLWKRYVDDIIEVVPKDKVEALTEHLNSIDDTGNIKFTHEQEENAQIPFLDTLIVRKEDGNVKLKVFRKKTHTDQYLSFNSHHPLYHKLGVVRTLFDRKEAIVTEQKDKEEEEKHITEALARCGYPRWAIEKVKRQSNSSKPNKEKKQITEEKSKHMVVLPYVKGTTETLQRIFRSHKVASAVRPHTTLRKLLVHPKDKIPDEKKCGVIYEVPCKNCAQTYIGETGRQMHIRIGEHRKEVEELSDVSYTRSRRKQSEQDRKKSAITDHACKKNHLIDWEGTKVKERESDDKARKLREAIWIRKQNNTSMNREGGAVDLPAVWDQVFATSNPGGEPRN